jgi:hypothetical protein
MKSGGIFATFILLHHLLLRVYATCIDISRTCRRSRVSAVLPALERGMGISMCGVQSSFYSLSVSWKGYRL